MRRSRISACCPGGGGPAAWYRRLASIAFHTILFTAAGLGVYCNPPYTPSGICNVFLKQTGSNQTKGAPPSFTTGHIVHLAHDPCVKGEGGQPWFVLFMCFRLKTGQNWPANARVNGYRVLAVQTGPARTEGSIKSH